MDRVDTLPYDHECVKYVESRGIPKETWNRIYHIDNIKNIVQLNEKYSNSIITSEPRLALPFFNKFGKLTGVTLRGMRGESLRYIMVKVDEDAPTVFGMDNLDEQQPITVVEGPIDSLFLRNSIACAGTSFNKIDTLGYHKDLVTIVLTINQRTRMFVNLFLNTLTWVTKSVYGSESIIEKDINDMVDAGIDVQSIIDNSTFAGLSAKLKFTKWKKC